jgi:hypothetical protein
MLYGHIAVGMAAKPFTPTVRLGVLLLAAMAIDTLCGLFVLVGIEWTDAGGASYIPWSHGLFMAVVWSAAGFALSFLLSRDRRTALVIGLLVYSHWLLDFISHPMGMGKVLPRDLPLLFGGSPKVGLGLYNSLPAALLTDLGMLAGAFALYLSTTRAVNRPGRWGPGLLLLFVALLAAPAAIPGLEVVPALAMVLLLPLGNWVDRNRTPVKRRAAERADGQSADAALERRSTGGRG